MNKPSIITSVESNLGFQEMIFESLINRLKSQNNHKENTGTNPDSFSANFKNIDWCCAPVVLNGTVDISFSIKEPDEVKSIHIPVISGFLVICTKQDTDNYKVTWSCSMS
jgi:hypothetical protein